MKQEIADYFEQHASQILTQACTQYEINPDNLKQRGSFENFVFEYRHNDSERILRLTDSEHRHPDKIYGELEWINYLADGGVSVSRGIESKNGRLVEVIPIDSTSSREELYFSAVVFEKAPGAHAAKEDWTERLFTEWGELTGKMHRLARSYRPSKPEYRRHDWRDDEDLNIAEILPPDHDLVIERFERLITRLRALPMSPDSYGLIHVDFHHWNFFVHQGKITLFDFDDCHYDWFVNDIAIPLFYASRSAFSGDDSAGFAKRFLRAFMLGYRRENDLPDLWFAHMHEFMKLREILLYSIILAEEADKSSEWCRKLLDGRKERIEQERPVIDVDFGLLCR